MTREWGVGSGEWGVGMHSEQVDRVQQNGATISSHYEVSRQRASIRGHDGAGLYSLMPIHLLE